MYQRRIDCLSAVFILWELLHLEAVTVNTLFDVQPMCVAIFVVIPCDSRNSNFCSLYSPKVRFRCTKADEPLDQSKFIA